MRVVVSPRVGTDIDEIHKKIKSLGRFRRIHPLREDLPAGMRSAVYGSHLILYRIGDKSVDVARVVHSARDLPSLFDES